MKPIIWHHCYDEGWKGLITGASFVHPAKMARGLLERIIKHGFERGYWQKGSLIGDPFGGVGTTGIIGTYHGLRVVSNELEPKFVGLAEENFSLHASKWRALDHPAPVIHMGDSRRFDLIVHAILTSPPYAHIAAGAGGLNHLPAKDGQQGGRSSESPSQNAHSRYGDTEGQIAGCSEGSVGAVISSPPYGAISVEKNSTGVDHKKQWETYRASGGGMSYPKFCAYQDNNSVGYGHSEGQISDAKKGDVDAVISSPPYANSVHDGNGIDLDKQSGRRREGVNSQIKAEGYGRTEGQIGGESPGQIGTTRGQTYWEAMAEVYGACFRSMRPGGVACIVVKDYVKKGKRVPLCDDTMRLLVHVGFEPVERIHAMLVRTTEHDTLFGDTQVETKTRLSFFRRVAEKKGSPPIHYEEVLIVRRAQSPQKA